MTVTRLHRPPALGAWMTAVACLFCAPSAAGQQLERIIPDDAMIVLIGRPMPNPLFRPSGDSLLHLLGLASDGGMFSPEVSLYVDLTGFLPLLGKHPHALALLDVTSDQIGPRSYRLSSMQVALLIESDEDTQFVQQIGRLITHHTDSERAELVDREDGDLRWRQLHDHRLAPWAVFEWGRIGPCLALTFGEGTYERLIRAWRDRNGSLMSDGWFPDACRATRSEAALLSVYLHLDRIRQRLSEVTGDRPQRVAEAMDADNLVRALWTLGFDQRAMFLLVRYGWRDRDQDVALADPRTFDPKHVHVVPDEATAYTVITLPKDLTDLVDQFVAGYLAAQSIERAARKRADWSELEKTVRLNVRRDLLDQLGRHVIIHNYPRHPLGWPIACTILVEIKPGRSVMVRRSIDAFISRWAARWEELGGGGGPVGWRHTPEGYWVLRTGFEWLSIGVTDRYVILGWSPEVVRENVHHLADLARQDRAP